MLASTRSVLDRQADDRWEGIAWRRHRASGAPPPSKGGRAGRSARVRCGRGERGSASAIRLSATRHRLGAATVLGARALLEKGRFCPAFPGFGGRTRRRCSALSSASWRGPGLGQGFGPGEFEAPSSSWFCRRRSVASRADFLRPAAVTACRISPGGSGAARRYQHGPPDWRGARRRDRAGNDVALSDRWPSCTVYFKRSVRRFPGDVDEIPPNGRRRVTVRA